MSAAFQHLLEKGDLEELIRRALLDPDIKESLEYSSLSSGAIRETLGKNFDEAITAVREEASVFEELKSQADYLRDKWLSTIVPFKLQYLLAAAIGVMGFLSYLWVKYNRFGWPRTRPDPVATVSSWLLPTIGLLVWAEVRRRRNNRIKDDFYREYDAVEQNRNAARKKFKEALVRKGIVPALREILNRAITPSYSAVLKEFSAAGLAEVFDPVQEVTTEARRKLGRLLTLPGGSIGLAGPRGAGKTTLLSLVCTSPVSERQKDILGLVCAAPIEYNPREFLLTLFSLVCSHVLGPREQDQQHSYPAATQQTLGGPIPMLMRFVGRAGTVLGISLLMFGFISASLLMREQGIGDAPHGPQPTSSAKQQPEPTRERSALAQYLTVLDLKPSTFLMFGISLLILGFIATQVTRSGNNRQMRIGESGDGTALQREARRNLRDLRFQQSYSSGWSGALKLPLGLEGGTTAAETLAQNQLSLPEIVERFRRFLRVASTEFSRVLIGIDELDKMESDEKAHLFLNEIKAIFGVPGVFFLVSVSENAISSFERRGLPFRDVFDSSFDTIVYVGHLNLDGSKRILKRRTTGLPEPFIAFCHCLSGGLPRDLIRACRDMVE